MAAGEFDRVRHAFATGTCHTLVMIRPPATEARKDTTCNRYTTTGPTTQGRAVVCAARASTQRALPSCSCAEERCNKKHPRAVPLPPAAMRTTSDQARGTRTVAWG